MASRGGKRQGRTGGGYTNRTDLMSAGRPLPVASPADQTYGQRAQMEQAQRAMPMASQPGLPAAAPQAAPAQAGPALAPPSPADHLFRPTERPNEPVTAGLPMGPGPGPEALGPLGQGTGGNMAQMLGAAAQASGSPTLGFLARQATAQGQ